MIYELDTRELSDMICDKLSELGLEVVLTNPKTTNKFPCFVLGTIMKSIAITEDGIPVRTDLSISVEVWDNSKRNAMQLNDQAEKKLRELNFIKTLDNVDGYDDITKKYRLGGSYEASYNGLTNSLERRR